MRLILEQRYLFDGSVTASARPLHRPEAHPGADTHASPDLNRPVVAKALASSAEAAAPAREVLFVDPRVADWQALAASVPASVAVVVIDPARDGLRQVQDTLAARAQLDAIHFLTYGKPGEADLGTTAITPATLDARADTLAAWRGHLAPGAQIDFWGCDVGAGDAGRAFVERLHDLTGAGVAASTDATGAASLHGDWVLEQRIGVEAAHAPFSPASIQAYEGVLDRPTPSVTFSGAPASVLLGSSFTESVTFQNTAGNGVGYGPFIDLFAPHNPAETATLTGAAYLGSALTVTPVALSASVAGHVGTVGALHPLAVDSTGAPLFVAAPSGFAAGDTLYVVTLPFGSFTPGQPAAKIDLTFSAAGMDELTSAHPGEAIGIAAVGGFQFGADPLNDPAADPSIRGTSGTEPPGASDAGNGLIATSSAVSLLDFSATVATAPGEAETATGPSFPAHYIVTLDPAPATAGNPISNLAVSFALPDGVRYTGGAIAVAGASGTPSFTAGATPDGGSVHVDFASLASSGAATTVDVPVYVPDLYGSSAAILDPVSGAPVTIGSPTASYSGGVWNPPAGSLDAGSPQTVTGSAPAGAPTFAAKSLALQETVADLTTGDSTTRPGDTLRYTIRFEVSDYAGIDHLQLQNLLGDGLAVDNTVAPVLSVTEAGATSTISLGAIAEPGQPVVNGQTVATSGSAPYWTYSRDNALTGQTTLSFDAGGAIATATGSSKLEGPGAVGTLTFTAKVLDKYTNTHVNPLTQLPGSLTETDTLASTATGTGDLLTAAGTPTDNPARQVSDSSGASVQIPPGAVSLQIVAIDGVAVSGPVTIHPGDNVTYRSTYDLTSGDFAALHLAGYLPLPAFTIGDPLADGSNAAFAPDSSGAYPSPGGYRLVSAPSGVAIQGVGADTVANGLTFDLGAHDDPSNTPGQSVAIDFTLRATSRPAADQLLLTTQAQSTYSNSLQAVTAQSAVKQITLSEPNLVLKTGIVSLVDDGGAAKSVPFTVDGTGGTADPTGTFNPADTTGSPFPGAIPTGIGALENLNVAGADGADTARVVVAVQNTGTGPAGAFDVTLNGTLPAGITTSAIVNLRITRGDGTALSFTRPDGSAATAADFFTPGGILVQGAGGSATPALFATGDAAHRDVLFVTYDLALPAQQGAGATLVDAASVVNFASRAGGVAAGDGFVSGGAPVGGTAASIADTATIATTSPALAKSIGASDVPAEDNRDAAFPSRTVVIGETRPVTILVTLPEGTLTNGAGDVRVTEALPSGETFAGLVSVTPGSGVSLSPPGTVATVSGSTITFDLGPSVVNANADGSGTVAITYDALFPNGAGVNGSVLTSTANLVYGGAAVPPATVAVVEHDPAVTETITDDSGGALYSGRVVTYTMTVRNTGVVDANALSANALIPTGLAYVAGSLAPVSGGTNPAVNDGNPADLTIGLDQLAPGETAIFRFQATVAPNLAAGTQLSVRSTTAESSYHSIPASVGPGRAYTLSATDTRAVGGFTSTLRIVGEANGTAGGAPSQTTPVSSANVTAGDIVRLHAAANVPEGSNPAVVLDFALPAGLTYANDGTTTIALVSPGGDVASSTLDPAGNMPGLQVAGTVNAATYQPGYIVSASAIDTSVAGHLRINLGALSNNDNSPQPNAIVLEFNGIVGNVAGNHNGTALAQSLTVLGATSNTVTETVKEPSVSITKTVTAVASATGIVTYKVKLANTGTATAYGIVLNDPESSNENPISGLSQSGAGSNIAVTSGNGTSALQATLDLAAGASETFTYQVPVTNPSLPVPNVTTTDNYRDLKTPAVSLSGTSSGASGSATGGRDGVTAPASLNTYNGAVASGLGTASGQVWQALGATPGTYDPLTDTPLGGVLVTARTAGPDGAFGTGDDLVQTTTTAADGTYGFGLLPNGAFRITLPASGASGLPGAETLISDPFGSTGTLPATASSATNGTAQPGVDFAFALPDTAPALGNLASGTRTLTPGTPIALSSTGAATVADAELDRLVAANEGYSYAGAQLVVQRTLNGTAAPNAADSFGGDGTLLLAGGSVSLSGVTVGTYTQTGGVLSLTFNASASAPTVSGVLDHLTFATATANSFNLGLTVGATLADGNISGQQGTGGVKTSAPALAALDLAPATASVAASFTEPNDSAPAAVSAAVDPALTLADSLGAGATLSRATVAITGNFAPGEDQLAFSPAAGSGDIAGSYAGGVLTLTSASGATAAQWQAALEAVRYYDGSDRPSTAPRAVTVSVTDQASGHAVSATAVTLSVAATNDSPVLDVAVPVALPPATEDASAAPAGAVGTLVASIAGTALNVTDPDGANTHDGAALALGGIAVVGADTARGNWWFSTDGGASWTQFAGAGIATPVSSGNALHLLGDAGTRLYFQPTSADFNGALPNALQFRAWDQFDPVANGGVAALPTDAALGTGINTAASSYSSAVRVLPLAVRPVNDAPLASGSATLAPGTEDAAPPGATVASLFAAAFSDTADQQASPGNPSGSAANTLAGIAVVGDATPAAEGLWRYSVDAGATWTALPAGLSDANALLLSAGARLDFLPAPDFNGAPPPLAVRLIDSSTDLPLLGATTGADLGATIEAIPGADVSGTHQGGASAVSAATVPLATSVAAVNDAPIATGTAALPPEPQDAATPTSATIAALFGAAFSDGADAQRSALNPTGSVADPLAGIALVGNPTPASQGVWRYSTDGGATYAAIPTDLADGNALLLPASGVLEFVAAPGFNGAPLPLTARLVDGSAAPLAPSLTGAGLAAGGAAVLHADVSGPHQGGTTPVSAGTVPLAIAVGPVNHAPVATGDAILPATTEDASSPPGDTVAALFGANFSDAADQLRGPDNPTGSVAGTLAGVAVTGNATPASDGAWRYSLDNGATWTALPSGLSDTSATLLSASARLDFLPAPDFNGAPPPLAARLIDTSADVPLTGTTTGADLGAAARAIAGVDVSGAHQGGSTAVSAATVTLTTGVAPVNDAPIASGAATLAPVPEDTAAPPGATVASLLGPSFGDAADQQRTDANPSGSVADAFAGVAMTGNLAAPTQGAWRYSVDGGATFADVPRGVSDSAALVLPVSARLVFVPAPDYNGTPGGLAARLIEGNSLVPASGVDVSGGNHGGSTAVSADTVPLSTRILPVNDAPLAAGAVDLPEVAENAASPPGDTVAHLFGPALGDAADAQAGPGNPDGSTANAIAGIAITGNAADPIQGAWRYSLDDGASWTALPPGLSDGNALVLGGNARLQFLPAYNFSGTPGGLTARVIETSSDVPISGALTGASLAGAALARPGVDVSGAADGGRTSISAGMVALDTRVAPDFSPLAGESAALPPVVTGDPAPGMTAAALYRASFFSPSGQTLAGLVIVGDAATPEQGAFRYSLDGGATFAPVPVDVSAQRGLVLPAGAVLSFLPAPGFTGAPGALTAYLVGTSGAFLAPGLHGADVAGLTAARVVDLSGLIGSRTAPITTSPVQLYADILPRPPVAAAPSGLPQLTSNPDTDRNRDVVTARRYDPLFATVPERAGFSWDWLEGSEIRRFIVAEQLSIVDVPETLFHRADPDRRLEYRAQLPGGLPLPDWLRFDPRTLTLAGTPPIAAHGTLDVQIVARDEAGRTATGDVHLRIGRNPAELLALLRTAERSRPAATPAPDHRPVRGQPARPAVHRPHAVAPPADAPRPARAGFSEQLRGFSAGARAQALLDRLAAPNISP